MKAIPEVLQERIIFIRMLFLKNAAWKDVHDELMLRNQTETNMYGLFLTYTTHIDELRHVDYEYVERLPRLISCCS